MRANSFFPMKAKTARILFAAALVGPLSSFGQTSVTSDPVGFVNVNVGSNSEVPISAPLTRAPALTTIVSSVSGNVITVGTTMTAGQFVPGGAQTDNFYVLVKSTVSPTSAVKGKWFQVTQNTATTLTVDQGGVSTVQAQGLAANDSIQVIPFWTLNTLFPSGQGVDPTINFTALQGQVLLMPQEAAGIGINVPADATFIYWTGGQGLGNGWYNIGTGAPGDNQVVNPDMSVTVRNPGSAKQVTFVGTVPRSPLSSNLNTIAAGQAQDNMTGNPLPVPLTLTQLNLFESGAFTPTTNFTSLQDQLLLFASTTNGFNAPADKTLIYWTGGQGLTNGWYNIGTGAGPLDNTEIVQPGAAFVVRKAATGSPSSANWTVTPPYPH